MGKVVVKQHVPKHAWYLIPCPKAELRTHLLDGKRLKDNLKIGYDFYTSTASLNESIKLDNKHKLKISATSCEVSTAVLHARSLTDVSSTIYSTPFIQVFLTICMNCRPIKCQSGFRLDAYGYDPTERNRCAVDKQLMLPNIASPHSVFCASSYFSIPVTTTCVPPTCRSSTP